MGRTHRMESTFARLAEPLGYVPKEDILYAVKAIVVTQRENGRRDDRKYSRMKYLVSSWGIEKFKDVVEQYYGKKFEPSRELPEWEFKSYLGWHEQVLLLKALRKFIHFQNLSGGLISNILLFSGRWCVVLWASRRQWSCWGYNEEDTERSNREIQD